MGGVKKEKEKKKKWNKVREAEKATLIINFSNYHMKSYHLELKGSKYMTISNIHQT